jgi:hypothetical protein
LFTDPQSVTVNSVANSLPAISRDDNASTYRSADGNFELIISRTFGKRNRFSVRVNQRKIAADPLVSANNVEYRQSAYIVMDAPPVGYTNTEIKDLALGLAAWATSANLLKVTGGET